jgi:hypothetical protein
LTKDINPIIRQNSAIGLAEMGPHTIRTLLIGLHDENFNVRKTVEKEITEKFSVESILASFSIEKSSHRMSLKIAVRDIIEKEMPINLATKKFFQNLLAALEKDRDRGEREHDKHYDNINTNFSNQTNYFNPNATAKMSNFSGERKNMNYVDEQTY